MNGGEKLPRVTSYRPKQATFKSTNDDCWTGAYQADVNGVVNIADRSLTGESRSREHPNDNDSAEDVPCLTVSQDSLADAEIQ